MRVFLIISLLVTLLYVNAFPVPICDLSDVSLNTLQERGYQSYFDQFNQSAFILTIRPFTNNTIPPSSSSSTGPSINSSSSLPSNYSSSSSSSLPSNYSSSSSSTGWNSSSSGEQWNSSSSSSSTDRSNSSSSSSFSSSSSSFEPSTNSSSSSPLVSSSSSSSVDQTTSQSSSSIEQSTGHSSSTDPSTSQSSSSSVDVSTSQSSSSSSSTGTSSSEPSSSSSSVMTGTSSSQSVAQSSSSTDRPINQSSSSSHALRRLLSLDETVTEPLQTPIDTNAQYYGNNQSFVLTFDLASSRIQPSSQSLKFIGFLIYAMSFTPYQKGSFSLYQSISPLADPVAVDPKCFHPGMIDNFDQTIDPSVHPAMPVPYSLFFDSPDVQSAGNVTINALVLFETTNATSNLPISYYQVLPSLTLSPQSLTDFSKPSTSFVRLSAIVIGGGNAEFTVEFDPSMDPSVDSSLADGGAFVNQFIASIKECDACRPRDYLSVFTTSTTYPTYARFHFTSPSLELDEFYILDISIVNAAGYQSSHPFQYTFKNSKREQIGTAPVNEMNQSISAGGVFGIVIGLIAFLALAFGVTRFYQRKGQFREHVKQISSEDTNHLMHEDQNQSINQSDLIQDPSSEEEEVDYELETQVMVEDEVEEKVTR